MVFRTSIWCLLSAVPGALAMVLDTAWTRTYGKGYGRQILVLPDSGFLLSTGNAVLRLDKTGEP